MYIRIDCEFVRGAHISYIHARIRLLYACIILEVQKMKWREQMFEPKSPLTHGLVVGCDIHIHSPNDCCCRAGRPSWGFCCGNLTLFSELAYMKYHIIIHKICNGVYSSLYVVVLNTPVPDITVHTRRPSVTPPSSPCVRAVSARAFKNFLAGFNI